MAVRVSELRNGAAKAGNGHARAALGSYGDLDDRMLVLDFQAGNEEAFTEIHRRYCGLARHVCQRILHNPDDADEATQEAMLRVYQGLARFNGRYALQPWVARIATNVSLDVTRAWARRPRRDDSVHDLDEDPGDHSEDPLEVLERRQECERVTKVLAALPEHHRDALVLREFEGRSHKEIANRLGVTPPQAKALIHRAKGSFRRAWNGGMGIQAFIFILAALSKLPQLVKKVLQPAQELAATSTAAPVVTSTVVTTGERVTAAAVAVLVAGSAAVGVVTLKHPNSSKPTASPAPQVVVPVAPPPVIVRDQRSEQRAKAKLIAPLTATAFATPAVAPVQPSASPTLPPSSTPLPEPEGFTLSFVSDVNTDYRCDCGTAPVITGNVNATEDGDVMSFSATIDQAGAADATGDIAWSLWLQESSQDAHHHAITFELKTPDGPYRYMAEGVLLSKTKTLWGGWTFVFQGSYSFYSGPTSPGGAVSIPGYGIYRATVSVSTATKRVIDTSITLIEDPSSPTPLPSASPTP